MTRVTVGLPVYNGGRFLEHAISSVLSQTYRDLELVISDNASTDETQEVCRAACQRDPRVRYYRNSRNLGAAPNYNLLPRHARGEYFKWVAHDDVLEGGFIETCLRVMDERPELALCYTRTLVIDDRGTVVKVADNDTLEVAADRPHLRMWELLRSLHFNPACNAVFGLLRTDMLRRTSLIGSYISSDRNLLLELSLRGTFLQVAEPLFRRRVHQGASRVANLRDQERLVWFDSSKTTQNPWEEWRLLAEYHASVRRARLGLPETLRCSRELYRFARLRRTRLKRELLDKWKSVAWRGGHT